MIINLPKLGPVKFRDDLTQEQFQTQLQALSQKFGFELPRPEYGIGESFTRGVSRGLSRMGSVITDTIPALVGSAIGNDEYARQQLEEAAQKEAELQQENPAQFTSYKQAEGLGGFARFGAEALGETVPDILGIIGTGGVGGALAKRGVVKGAEQIAENIARREAVSKVLPGGVSAERAAELEATALRRAAPAIEKAQATGQAAGIYLGSYATNTPDVFQSIYEQTGELSPGVSLLFGGAVAALDAVLPSQLAKSLTQTEKLSIAEKILERSGMKPSLLRKATAIIPATAAKEGLTEGAQEVITAAAEKFVDSHQDIWDSDHFNRYIESAVRGAVAGAPFGGVQAVGERMGERGRERRKEYEEYQQKMQKEQPREPQQLDLFRPGEITPPSPGLTFPPSTPPAPPQEPVTARTKYEGEKQYRKTQLGLRQPSYETLPTGAANNALFDVSNSPEYEAFVEQLDAKYANSGGANNPMYLLEQRQYLEQAVQEILAGRTSKPTPTGQMEMFEPEAKGKKALQPTREADVQALAREKEAEYKKKIAEGKADAQALKEIIDELAPKDIDLLDYAQRTGVTSTPLFQLIQQATQIPQRKGAVPQGKVQTTTEETTAEEPIATTVLTVERLKDTGLSPRAGIFKRLVGKDLVADAEELRAEIEKAFTNPNLAKSTITALQNLEGSVPLTLTQPTLESLEARTTPTAPELQTQEAAQKAVLVVPKEQMAFDFNAPVEEPAAAEEDIHNNYDKAQAKFEAAEQEWISSYPEFSNFTYNPEKYLDEVLNGGYEELNNREAMTRLSKLADLKAKADAAFVPIERAANAASERLQEAPATAPKPPVPMQYSPEEVWDDMDTGVPYADLSKENKELWGEAVKSRMATPERADSIAARNKITKKETKRKKPVAEEPPDIGEREAAEFEQPKKSVGEKEEYKPTTGANIIRAIKDAFVSGAQFDRWVRVYDTQQEAIEAGVLPKDTEGRVQGFFHDGKVFLIAENIEQGQELGVFLHEFGVHFGLPRLIGKENVEKLGKQISEWALGSGRLENELARKALARIPEGTDPRDVNEELIAYFVEEAFAAGITPQGIKDNKYYNTGMMDVVQFVRRFLAALKIALRKIGFAKFDNLTAENIVDLAYGAADLELDGSYHGTAALFRRFNHEFMGSGEGAQAFGWGSYLAQRFGIGKDYFKKDIKRKTKYQERQFGLVDKNGNIVEQNITNLLDSINVSGSKPISKAILKLEESFAYAKRRYERQIKISQDLEGFLDSRGDAFYPENTRSENLALLKEITEQNLLVTRSELERSAKALEVLKDFESRGLEFIQTQADTISPEGTILRVRPLVSEHEMLDWFATLDSQPSGVKKVIGKLLNRLDQKTPGQEFLSSFLDDELERLNKDFDELTGQDLIGTYGNPGILVKAISEALLPEANDQVEPYQAASELLDSLGVKGIRFFDESSRETGRYLQKARIEGTDIVFPGYAGIESYPTKEAAEKALARAKGKMTYNLVIFNDKNLARVSEYRAGEPSRPKFSKRAANQQRTTLMEGFDNFVNMPFTNLPPASEKIVNGAFNALSTVKPSLRSAALGFLSLDQLAELYGKIMPSIKKLINVLERRATDVATRREFLERNIKKYHDVFKKYKPEQKAKFFQTFFDTTVEQIDPLIVTVKETIDSNGQVRRTRTYSLTKNPTTAGHPISQAFYSMPKEVQEVYVDMRREYDKYADELENLITKDVTPGTAKKLRTQFELKRLKVYLPLFRQGNYWLSYTDVSGEPVVMAFTTERERQLEKQHANSQKAKDIKEFARFEDIVSRTGQPPVGFVAGVIDTLQKEKVPKAVLDQVYSSYLSLFPAESVRQMYRKRKGIAGYETDAVEVFGNVGSRMVNQIGNLTHAKEIDAAMNGIIMEGEKDGSMVARDVAQNIAAQTQYMMNPIPNKWSARASSFSYYMYIAGNVSSAIINLTQLPIVVYGLLAGEYSAADAAAAMKSATSMYLNGAKDNNSTFLPDWTFGAGKNLRPDLKRLYDAAVQQAVIRRSTSHEIVDMRKATAGDYAGLRAKVETGLAWVFQNSERANREITLIAAYELARKKGLSEAAAIAKAMDTVKAAHGSALSETAPRYFQGDVGRVIFTFKRFAQSQIYLLGKLFNQAFRDADPKVRDVARKQLLGIYGMSFIFAGAHGVPLYGAGVMLAGFLMGDDDDPVDIEGYLNEALGDLIYKGPVNQLLNIDIAGRTGFNGMVWRDNPKRLAEVGPVTYMLEQLAGPSYSAALSVQKGLGMIADGEAYRGFEAMTPGAIKNVMKGMRFAIDGATNRDGVPIVQDVNAYNVVMQMVGFTPADLAEAYARAGAKKEVEKKILERRTSLLDKLYAARQDGDLDGVQEVRESIRAFNQKNPEKNVRIEQSTMERSYRGHKQREKEMEDGVHLNRALKHRLNEDYGTDED